MKLFKLGKAIGVVQRQHGNVGVVANCGKL